MPPSAHASRSANACDQCRRRKVKCSGDKPCRTCTLHNAECTFLVPGRGRYSNAYVQQLLNRIRQYEEQTSSSAPAQPSPPSNPPLLGSEAQEPGPPAHASPAASQEEPVGLVSPASKSTTERASGPTFELRVRSLLRTHTIGRPTADAAEARSNAIHAETGKANVKWQSTLDVLDGPSPSPELVLPSQEESVRLLDLFVLFLGTCHYYLDQRVFADNMALLFQDEDMRRQQMGKIWFVEYLLVLALAKLLDSDTRSSVTYPGAVYFGEAVRLLPQLYELGAYGVAAVEILSLVALYLQWCNRRHDAYLYIGTAIRLAIALGMTSTLTDEPLLPSERAHRIRVWWTAFMLDRRLAAVLDLPFTVDDRQLAAELPQHSPGMPSPDALIINVQIARTTGDIMTSLYGNAAITEVELVRNIQRILFKLYSVGHTIPAEYAIDFSLANIELTRTGGTLYSMLFSAIILCIRPILLQRVKDKVLAASSSSQPSPGTTATPVIDRLCYTLGESATKTIRMLYALKRKKEIARFGYFDLDCIFTSALTLVMSGFVHGVDASHVPVELIQAIEILRYLSQAGNQTAAIRLRDIYQFCRHVWPDMQIPDETSAVGMHTSRRPSRTADNSPSQAASGGNASQHAGDAGRNANSDTLLPTRHTYANNNNLISFDPYDDFLPDLLETDGIYSSFNDPHLPLTGVDQTDWGEMERIFAARPT